ncbi:MAG: glycerol-3-phosphate dehydrogenase/oxidase [Steroidobacteraceae bacterium]
MSFSAGADFDVDAAVIGAGIHGAGMAQAAAAAGHSVLVLEQTAIAAGTSSRSSKLIHGGLRYLETGQLHLVRESLHERATLLRLAPELVHLQRFYIPLYAHTRRRPWQLRTGLSLYALLAGLSAEARFSSLPPHAWGNLDGLDRSGLERVYCYQDAQTDDRALTGAVLRSAQSLGARLLCPAQFTGATLSATGADVRFLIDGREQQCRARVLINAAGPWADTLARRIAPAIPVPELQRVQGAHIVLAGHLERGIYYVESPRDGRAVFVMPWQGRLLVGTTETRFRGDPGQVSASHAELHYLLGVLKAYFPGWRTAGLTDIADSFAGLRLLPGGPGHAFHRSRETLLVSDRAVKPRVLSIYGGKLTTYRAVAQRALARVADSLPRRVPLARTDQLPLLPA